MTYLKRAMMEHPEEDPQALVLFHCPHDFGLPVSCPKWAESAAVAPPALCYLCWSLEVADE